MKLNAGVFLTIALLLLAISFLTSDFIVALPTPVLVIVVALSIALINFSILIKIKERQESTVK